jgi:hypothetical protein
MIWIHGKMVGLGRKRDLLPLKKEKAMKSRINYNIGYGEVWRAHASGDYL